MIKLHYLKDSRALRVLWLLEELALPYDIELYLRDKKTYLAPQPLKKIHPLGKSPVIVENDLVVAESAVIIEYLAETYAGVDGRLALIPTETGDYRQYRYWMHYAEGSLMPFLVMNLVFEKIKTAPMPFVARPIAKTIANRALSTYISPNIETHLEYLDQHLKQHAYFAGQQISGADFQMSYPVSAMVERLPNMAQFTGIMDYMKRLSARPAFQRAQANVDAM